MARQNKRILYLQCLSCKKHYDYQQPINQCAKCHRPLQLILELGRIKNNFHIAPRQDMWRYQQLVWPFEKEAKSLGEGFTPIFDCSHITPAIANANKLMIKDEGDWHSGFGRNPTRRFKDRGMAMVINHAIRLGLKKLVVPTQGNAGDSLAWYCSQFGLECAVIMPESTPSPIKTKVETLAKQYPDIYVDYVKGTIREAAQLMQKNICLRNFLTLRLFRIRVGGSKGKRRSALS